MLSLLRLPQDAIRWVALVALVAIGLGLIFPKNEELLERPFSRIPQKKLATRSNAFGLGLALGRRHPGGGATDDNLMNDLCGTGAATDSAVRVGRPPDPGCGEHPGESRRSTTGDCSPRR